MYLCPVLARFIALANNPALTRVQLEGNLHNIQILFHKVHIWHRIKFLREDPVSRNTTTADSIHVQPSTTDNRGHSVPCRFDTALVNDGTGGDTGVEGKCLCLYAKD
jgi:hypothetical protein